MNPGWHQQDPAVLRLIEESGRVNYGWWDAAIADFGVDDLRVPHPMRGMRQRFSRFWRFKRWEFWLVDTGLFLLGFAVIDLGYAQALFMYHHRKGSSHTQAVRHRYPLLLMQGVQREWAVGAVNSRTLIRQRSISPEFSLVLHYGASECHLEFFHKKLGLEAQFKIQRVEPLSLCLPAGADGWTYTCKEAGMPVRGYCVVQGQRYAVDNGLASVDISLGLMRRETCWQWGTLMGEVAGQVVAVNLAMGVNESGQTENVMWVNGRLHKLPPVSFHAGADGCAMVGAGVDLNFVGAAAHGEYLNLGILASRFVQWQGSYSGTVQVPDHNQISLLAVPGLWEDHFVRW